MLPPWIVTGLQHILDVQPGTSVLDLAGGELQALLPSTAYVHRTCVAVNGEPNTTYGLVLCHPVAKTVISCEFPCLETQVGPVLNAELATLEWALKCCSNGGILVALLAVDTLADLQAGPMWAWLKKHGTVVVSVSVLGQAILVMRHRVRLKDFVLEPHSFDTEASFLAWAAEHSIFKTGVCTEDPGPLEIKYWGIQLTDNTTGNHYTKPGNLEVTTLYKGKHEARVRWAGIAPALEWAQHQALQQPPEPSWDKAVLRFRTRLSIDTLMRLVTQIPLNQILNVPDEYPVVLDPAFDKFLQRRRRQFDRMQMSYPEKSTLENRYFTLGPGTRLVREIGSQREVWKVNFSEPDFGNHKPPRLHIQREI